MASLPVQTLREPFCIFLTLSRLHNDWFVFWSTPPRHPAPRVSELMNDRKGDVRDLVPFQQSGQLSVL